MLDILLIAAGIFVGLCVWFIYLIHTAPVGEQIPYVGLVTEQPPLILKKSQIAGCPHRTGEGEGADARALPTHFNERN